MRERVLFYFGITKRIHILHGSVCYSIWKVFRLHRCKLLQGTVERKFKNRITLIEIGEPDGAAICNINGKSSTPSKFKFKEFKSGKQYLKVMVNFVDCVELCKPFQQLLFLIISIDWQHIVKVKASATFCYTQSIKFVPFLFLWPSLLKKKSQIDNTLTLILHILPETF